MKKLIMLIGLLLVSFSSFSQNDTIVTLQEPVARLVIKDLISGDGARQELNATQSLLSMERTKLTIKDSIIGTLESKILNLNSIILNKDSQFELERQKSEELIREIKSQRRKTLLYKVGTAAGAAAAVILLVK